MRNESFKLVKDFIHSAQEDFPVGRKLFNQINTPFNEVTLFGFINRFRGELDDSGQDELSIVFIGDDCQKLNGFFSKGNVVIFETFQQNILPSVDAFFVHFENLDHGCNSKISHVAVGRVRC
jgi:hypothetical protein